MTEELTRADQDAAATTVAARAAIEARFLIAIKRPRDLDTVRVRLLRECERPAFAEAAIYRRPVGSGKFIEGLSIRFAEAAIRLMGNMLTSATLVFEDDSHAVVRVSVLDLETNATVESDVSVSKRVERRSLSRGQVAISERVNSVDETTYLVAATEDETTTRRNALVSKALRTLVLRIVPGDILDECEQTCRVVQAKRDATDPDAAKKRLFDGFAALGVTPEQIKAHLGHSNNLSPGELVELRGVYAAIKSHETTWAAVASTGALSGMPDELAPAELPDGRVKIGGKK